MSLDRSLPLQSPYLSTIKGRLSFSAVKSPSILKRLNHNNVSRINGSPFNNHLGDYHMSKQNPDVLDQMYSPRSSSSATITPKRDHSLHKKHLTPSEISRFSPSPTMALANRNNGRTPLQTSLLRQTLNNNHPTNSLSSLVHLATRGSGLQHMMNGIGRSPVTVKLSGVSTDTRVGVYDEGTSHDQSHEPSNNPCDKNVVMSALRQKRKRWATSAPGDESSNCLSPSGAPQAKRVRHSTLNNPPPQFTSQMMNVPNRKRSQTTPSLPAFKRSKVTNDIVNLTKLTNKVVIPEIECEETESESGGSIETGSQGSTVATDAGWSTESVAGSEPVWRRSMTPPTPLDETEMNKKREESLSALKAVFPAPHNDDKPSLRRKLPIFCATGSKPHLPTPLSVTHTVTQEDLKKDREATAAKLKQILTAENDKTPSSPPPLAATTVAPATSSSVPVATSTALSTAVNPLAGIKLGEVSSVQSSSLAVTSAPASITTSAVSAGVSQSTSTTGLTGAQTGLTGIVAPSVSTQQQTKSVSFAPLPTSTNSSSSTNSSLLTNSQMSISTTSATVSAQSNSLPLSQALASKPGFQFPPVSAPSLSSGQLSLGVPSTVTTVSTGLNLSMLQASTTVASNLSLQPPASGLASINQAINTASMQPPSVSGGLLSSLGTLQQPSTVGLNFSGLQQPTTTTVSNSGLNLGSLNHQAPLNSGPNLGITAPTNQSQASKAAGGFSLSSNLQFGSSGGSLFGTSASTLLPSNTLQAQAGGMFAPSKTNSSSLTQQQPSITQTFLSNPSANKNTSLSFPQQTTNNGSGTAPSAANGKPTASTGFSFNLSNSGNVFGNNPSSLPAGSGLNLPAPSSSQTGTSGSGGLLFGGNAQNSSIFGTQQQQQTASNGGTGSGFTFNLQSTPGKTPQPAASSGFNFSAGGTTGLTGMKPSTGGAPSTGLSLFNAGSTNTQQQSTTPTPSFNFGLQQPKSSGGQQMSLFGSTNQPSTAAAAGNSGFSFSLNPSNQRQQLQTPQQSGLGGTGGTGGIFGAPNNGLQQQQQNQTRNGITFPSGGMGMGPSMFSAGSGQQSQATSGLNFTGQNQNGSSGFNFSAGTGMGLGTAPSAGNSGFNFSAKSMGVNFGNQPQTVTNTSGMFNFGGGSQTPQQQQMSGMGMSLQTPTNQQTTPIAFNVGTTSRPMAKPRRRKK